MAEAEEALSLGPCCACNVQGPQVRNILMLPQRAPLPGRGWGCAVCGLAADGALAVLCQACLEAQRELVWACRGHPGSDGRLPIGALEGRHEHRREAHAAELAAAEVTAGEGPLEALLGALRLWVREEAPEGGPAAAVLKVVAVVLAGEMWSGSGAFEPETFDAWCDDLEARVKASIAEEAAAWAAGGGEEGGADGAGV